QRPGASTAGGEMPVDAPHVEHAGLCVSMLEHRFGAGSDEADTPKWVAHGLGDPVFGHVTDPGSAAGSHAFSDLAILLNDQDGGAGLPEYARGGEARRPAAHDHDVVAVPVHPPSRESPPLASPSGRSILATMKRA